MESYDLIDFVLENYGKTNEQLTGQWSKVSKQPAEKMMAALENIGFDKLPDRNNFFWLLQNLVEKIIYENPLSENRELEELAMGAWNNHHELKVNANNIANFLTVLMLRFTNSQKALRAVCDGDIESYKVFNRSPQEFINLLIRFLCCHVRKQKDVLIIADTLAARIFGDIIKKEVQESLNKMEFIQRDRARLHYAKMSAYGRMLKGSLAFESGMKRIILDYLTEDEVSNLIKGFRKYLLKPQTEIMKREHRTTLDQDGHVEPSMSEVKEDRHMIQEIKDTREVLKDDINEVSDHSEKIHHLIEKAQGSLKEIACLVGDSRIGSWDYVRMLEEENKRLKADLKQEKNRVIQEKEMTIIAFINALAGSDSGYLLSEMFKESEGELPVNRQISVGRLVNFFSSLGLLGIEPYAGSREIGAVFKVSREKLVKDYWVNSPIITNGSEIPVKLIQYGWTYSGKVIIPPVVEEIKGGEIK